MKIGTIPENLIERILLSTRAAPQPLFETFATILFARTVMVGTKVGVFDALAGGPLDADEIARRCGTDPAATGKLIDALIGIGYLRSKGGRAALTPMTRKWLLSDSPHSIVDNILFRFLEWDVLSNYEDFIRSGESVDAHTLFEGSEQWGLYQRGMRSLAGLSAQEVAGRVPVPRGASQLLDVGGSHGYYSVALCRRHSALQATVFDLPEAVEQAAPILAREGMGDRVVHRAGDALTDDFGTEAWDVIFTANLLHHFDADTNREFTRRAARALRPGGTFAILEFVRPDSPEKAGQMGSLLDLYFAMTSRSGTWTIDEMSDWQQSAGLTPQKANRLMTIPGGYIQAARK
jgi:SAM-dependent methyltransferase